MDQVKTADIAWHRRACTHLRRQATEDYKWQQNTTE